VIPPALRTDRPEPRVNCRKTSAGRFRLLRQEMLNDLPGGGAPDPGMMRADVFERNSMYNGWRIEDVWLYR